MELSLSHTLHLFNVFRENKDSDNCAQLLEEECIKMFGTKSLNDEHDCNVVSRNSLNIHRTNDDCTSHDENVSYKHVKFCGVHRVYKYTPNREDRYCKRHKRLETKWLQERLDDCAERFNIYHHPCELCNEHGHLNLQCKFFHDQIVSKNCDNLITFEHHKELSLLLGYEEMKRITEGIPKFNLDKLLGFDLEKIYMYCAVNCIDNPYIANYINKIKQIEDEENTNEREETSQYPSIISYDESGNEEELSIQPISSIRSSKRKVEPTHNVKKKKKRRSNKGKKVFLPNDVAPTTHCDDDNCYTIGAIHTINNESDYAYDMKRPKLGDAMFDENDMFENIFAAINVCPKLGDAMFNEDDIFSLPSFDMQIYNDDSMPPTYDDYIDESGFGRVSTLGSNDPTILEGVESYCDNYESGFGEVMTSFSNDSTISEEVQLIIMRTKLLLMMIIVIKLML